MNESAILKRYSPIPVANMNETKRPTNTSCLMVLSLVQANFSQMELVNGSIKANIVLKLPTNKSRKNAGATI
jgi:hypothetical protein